MEADAHAAELTGTDVRTTRYGTTLPCTILVLKPIQ